MVRDPRQTPDLTIHAATLPELLRRRAAEAGDDPAYTFLGDGEEVAAELTFAELDRRSRAVASALRDAGAAGERVLLLYPPGLDFVAAFLGCLDAGAVAVPAYPPASRRHLPRLRSIVADCRPHTALTVADHLGKIRAAADTLGELEGVGWLTTDEVGDALADSWTGPGIDPDDLAFLQYTSGSTAAPKGVMVSHRNLVHNEELIRRAFQLDRSDVIVGWLPLYHDMGLIGNLLQPLYLGARCIFMSPVAFLQKPVRWLRAIDRHRGTTSGGPNFAYDLCARKVAAEERSELDLSSWRVAFSGAEPVRAETLDRFAAAFEDSGFDRRAFYPCYGMAETTLMVSGGDPAAPPVVEELSAAGLEQDRAEPAAEGEPSRRLVGCGTAGWQLEVRVVDPESGEECADGRVGEIQVAGPSVAGGYWNRPELTEASFGARLPGGEGPFLRTGDLGFLRAGELFVTGRLKDLIIIRGRNHYPHDLELTAEGAHPSLRAGCGAAVAAEIDGEERLVIVYEVERRPQDPPEVIADAVRRAVAEEHQVQVYDAVMIRIGTVPKTSSGKIQRHACLRDYLAGELTVVGRSAVAADAAGDVAGAELELDRDALLAAAPEDRRHLLDRFLADRFARLTRTALRAVDPGKPLTALGLDSLSAVELKESVEGRLGVAVSLEALLEGTTLEQLAGDLLERLAAGEADATAAAVEPIPESGREEGDHPLSHGQRSLWYLHRLDPDGAAYNIAGAARLRDPLDADALRRSLEALGRRHPALRTTVVQVDGAPTARVAADPAFELEVVEAADLDAGALQERLADEAHRPFDLAAGPLLRVAVFRRAGGGDAVVLTIHHVVADFWSLALLVRELGALYAAETGGPAADLEPVTLTCGDHARWQRRRLDGPEGERLLEYWRRQLAGEPPILDLPTDRPRPQLQSFRGGVRRRRLDPELSARLEALAHDAGATPYMLLLAGFQTLLHRLSGQSELTVGSPMMVRDAPGLTDLVGYFVNPVVLRGDLAPAPGAGSLTFDQLLARTRATVLGAVAHRAYPFGLLVEQLGVPHDPARSPLFQVMFVFQKDRFPEEEGLAAFALGEPGVTLRLGDRRSGPLLESLPLERRSSQFDLTLEMAQVGDRLAAALVYNTDLFDAATADRFLEYLETLFGGVAENPGRQLLDLPLLGDAERRELLVEWNRRPLEHADPEGPWTLDGLLAAQAARTPEAVAVDDGERRLTYRDLDRDADRLARRLRTLGVGPEVPVGVCTERRAEMIVGLLGTLRAGGAYVPLDPDYPRQRLLFTLEDSGLSVLLVHGGVPEPLAGADVEVVDLAEDLPGDGEELGSPAADPDALAYLIYTSGSTGRPKGVAIAHRSAVTMVRWAWEVFPGEALAGVLASTSICFDLSVFEIFLPLSRGGRVVVARNALELPALGEEAGVTLVNTVPSAMAELAGRLPASVTTVNLAGEPLPRSLVEAIYAQETVRHVYNLYGPSEDTTYSTWARIPESDPRPPSIGVPVSATRAYLVDRRLGPTPRGVPGELLLGGDGLARGYLGRPALTAEKFIPDPFAEEPGARLYRTGDLARHRAGGELDFLGRIDHQVKVRGFRIELGEIEADLEDHPAIREAVALAREDHPGDVQLVAYLVAEGDAPEISELRNLLAERLPAFMVPQAFVFLDEMPRTPNGKVDRKSLPAPDRQAYESASAFVAPGTEVEEMLAEIWREVLEVEKIGIYDSFFDLGGHSLKATQVLARVTDAFGVELPLRSLIENPTIAGLEEAIARELLEGADEEEVARLLGEME